MLVCRHCGAQNPLGRIFCSACGSKLDGTTMAPAGGGKGAWRDHWVWRFWKPFVFVVVVAIAIPLILARIPQTERIGAAPASKVGVQRVRVKLDAMAELKANRRLEVAFSESDLNAYFKYGKAQDLGFESVSVDIRPDAMQVRVVKVGKQILGFTIPVSYDFTFTPAGPAVRSGKVRKGSLTLMGASRFRPVTELYRVMAADRDWRAFDALKTIRMEADRVVCDVRR